MHFVHWKVPFGMLLRWTVGVVRPAAGNARTVQRGAVPFSAVSVLRDFRNVLFGQPDFSPGRGDAVVELHPDDELRRCRRRS